MCCHNAIHSPPPHDNGQIIRPQIATCHLTTPSHLISTYWNNTQKLHEFVGIFRFEFLAEWAKSVADFSQRDFAVTFLIENLRKKIKFENRLIDFFTTGTVRALPFLPNMNKRSIVSLENFSQFLVHFFFS